MQKIEEIYRERLKLLIREAAGGSQAKFSALTGKSPAQISQWVNASKDSKTGKPRAMDRSTAREIERVVGKQEGWMDQPIDSELEFVETMRALGVDARKLTRADEDALPEWVRKMLGGGTTYTPDVVMHLPGKDGPVYVEVKMHDPGNERSAAYRQLESIHSGRFVFAVVDEVLASGGRELLKKLGVDSRSLPERPLPPTVRADDVRELRSAHGMAPILAWEHQDDLPEGEFVMVPRLDVHLSAGSGREQVEIELVKDNPQAFRSEWIRLMKLKPAKLAAMRASGESMEPTIHDGDSLLVDTSQTDVQDGKVYALWYDGGERVKRLFRLPGAGLRIVSDNPRHPPIEVGPDHHEHVRIIGRVVHRSGTGGL